MSSAREYEAKWSLDTNKGEAEPPIRPHHRYRHELDHGVDVPLQHCDPGGVHARVESGRCGADMLARWHVLGGGNTRCVCLCVCVRSCVCVYVCVVTVVVVREGGGPIIALFRIRGLEHELTTRALCPTQVYVGVDRDDREIDEVRFTFEVSYLWRDAE